jgi:hypothetical protein
MGLDIRKQTVRQLTVIALNDGGLRSKRAIRMRNSRHSRWRRQLSPRFVPERE